MSKIEENSYSGNKLIDDLDLNPIDIEICDVTLRDGEQTPGVVFTKEEKMNISNQLDSLGVEVIETGFPVVSSDEKDTVKQISNMGLNARTCCLSRALTSDVDSALDCNVDMVSIFVAMSDLHLIHKYNKSCEEMISCALDTIEYAKDHGLEVRFAAEDASRTNVDTLKNVFLRAQDYGVDYVSLADTVGVLNPSTTYHLVNEINKSVETPICIHCHNDLGMATANTLMAAEAGAKQLHTTVNGIGERAGNAPLEEVLMGLLVEYNIDRYDTTGLTDLSRMVEDYANITPPVNKAIVGKNAFTHESGIHVMAILENPRTYELFNPELVGGKRNLIVGKHTGIKALKGIVKSMGYSLEHDELCELKEKVKNCTDIKHGISRNKLEEMIKDIKTHGI
ncbi:pyruvate carboxyltransferase [Methanohalobium evestigatum Z-7303]|uniref:Pyruvate carboxyltransferase n=1 Tax=Methanohalobium evestigatum (strain ATCC BAA-1072 / DSM 3721 / NBRC 107634 / OCM 161 / Z-7303) TaxID=644295 RepID=D7E808_METEZ|nr:homocitrate synthase family protein [Methanohalobium evestigatum]ADI73350.1 pyruvate carboxyltransferase [Methanohalobium evestigatum Z-7303]